MSSNSKSIMSSIRSARRFLDLGPRRRQLDEQRLLRLRTHWRRLLLLGIVVSLFVHVLIMLVLSSIYRWSPAGSGSDPVQYEFAILQEEELTRLEQAAFDEMTTEAIAELEDLPEESAELSPDIPAVEMEFAASGAMPTLGGSGSGDAFGLTGGGSGTSFFGVSSSGTRFAYIVDKSGSMGDLSNCRNPPRACRITPIFSSSCSPTETCTRRFRMGG